MCKFFVSIRSPFQAVNSFTNNELIFTELPKSTILSRDCSNKGAMKYLENFEESCTHRVTNVSATKCTGNSSIFNVANYVNAFSFVSNPAAMNSTSVSFS